MSVNAKQFLVITTSLFLFNPITIHHASGQAMDYPPLWTSPRIPSAHIQSESVPFFPVQAIPIYSNFPSPNANSSDNLPVVDANLFLPNEDAPASLTDSQPSPSDQAFGAVPQLSDQPKTDQVEVADRITHDATLDATLDEERAIIAGVKQELEAAEQRLEETHLNLQIAQQQLTDALQRARNAENKNLATQRALQVAEREIQQARSLEVEQKERFRHAEELIENLKDQFNERTGSFNEELSRLHAQLKQKQDELEKTNQKAAELQIELEKSIKISRALATLAFFGQKPKSEINKAAKDNNKDKNQID